MRFSWTDLSLSLRRHTGPMTEELALVPANDATGLLPASRLPQTTARLVCGFCATGCGLTAHLQDGRAVNLTADEDYPVNLGMACPKGWEALTPLASPDRGTTPLLRRPNGAMMPIDWPHATAEFARRMREVQARHGLHSIAFLSTGQICTEEMALLGCLFKFGMGGLHCDSNTRQCMATAHVAYKQSFGFDAPPYTYADLEESDVLVFVGSNPCIAHPIMWQRVMRNAHRPEILVLDPRTTETAMAATQHYALRPKSDLTVLYGLARRLAEMGVVNRAFADAHTTGLDAFLEFVQPFTVEKVARASGLGAAQLERMARTIAGGKRVSYWWTMGVNQGHESTRTAQALINLALMTGQIGRPGTGANSITGQCNAMGSRLYSNVTSMIGGHDFAHPNDRRKVSEVLEIPRRIIPEQKSWAYDQIVDGIRDGQIRGLWVVATNSAHSWINQGRFNGLLDQLEFLVVQDLYPNTETARRAHLYLPAAGWGEKEGTFINSERRIGLVRPVKRPPGEALTDFDIFGRLAEAWGCGHLFRKWTSPEAAFQILKDLSRGQPCDMSGIRDYDMLEARGGVQWPWPEPAGDAGSEPARERRLFADGRFFTEDGRARFFFSAPRPPEENVDHHYPFVLLTGRGTSAQWHTLTRTDRSDVLRALAPRGCYVEINPADAARLGIRAQSRVRVQSRRGSLEATAYLTPTVAEGQVFIPMHYPEVNQLTLSCFDPYSRQPSYKHCAVSLEAGAA